MGENLRGDVFGWASREPGRVTFARQAGKETGSRLTAMIVAEFARWVAAVAAGLVAEGTQQVPCAHRLLQL